MRKRLGWAALIGVLIVGALAPITRATAPEPTPYPGGRWSPDAPTYGVFPVRNVKVPMSDGVDLTVDVYYPATADGTSRVDGTFPALLAQTPYTGSIQATDLVGDGPGAYFVQRGYIYVAADVRGTGRSGGNGQFFGARDELDGAELVRWIVRDLDGVNGVVGLHGCSYLGHTQVYTAAALDTLDQGEWAPYVKAMIPMCVSSDPYRDTYMENGIPAPAWEGAGLAAGTLLGPTIEAYMLPKYVESQQGGPDAYDGADDDRDSFWRIRDHLRDVPAIVHTGIPALLWNGWNDSGFGGLELYSALQNAAAPGNAHLNWWDPHPAEPATGRYQLILGDWGHGKGLDEGIELQWYDTWLKNIDTGLPTNTTTPVHVQDRVTHDWRNVSAYPFTMGARQVNLPFTTLTRTQTLNFGPSELPQTTLTYDLGDVSNQILAGPSAMHVAATTDAKDVMLRAELYDVAPDNTTQLVTWGAMLGSMRTLSDTRTWSATNGHLLRPFLSLRTSETVPSNVTIGYDIPLDPTLWTFQSGHHLRLRLLSLPDQQLCQAKQQAITTSAVGCRPRAAVMADLAGGSYTITMNETYLNVPLVSPLMAASVLGAASTGVEAPDRPEPLPTSWHPDDGTNHPAR